MAAAADSGLGGRGLYGGNDEFRKRRCLARSSGVLSLEAIQRAAHADMGSRKRKAGLFKSAANDAKAVCEGGICGSGRRAIKIIYRNQSFSHPENERFCPIDQSKDKGQNAEEPLHQSVSAPSLLPSSVPNIPGRGDGLPERPVIVNSEIPDEKQDKREDRKNVDSSRQWQSKPGKHGGRLLKGRSGAPGKTRDLTNPDSLIPSERNLEAESQIRDIQSALLLWQRDSTRGRSLSDRAVMVYQFFITHCRRKPREDGHLKCWHTVERIADSLCMERRTVERAIAELKKADILLGERERYENGKFGPRYFWILTPPDLTKYAPTSANSPNRHITLNLTVPLTATLPLHLAVPF